MTINFRNIILFWGFLSLLLAIAYARPNPKICRKREGKFPRPGTSCRGYYECKNYVPVEKMCGDGENFNANKGLCDWEDLYPCLEKQRDKECLRENGLFLKPETNCKKYYRCCNGKAKVEACSGDLLFDPSKGNCEWPDVYTCIESLSTTEKVSTVTIFETPSLLPRTTTDPAVSKSTTHKTTGSILSTHDPDFERTNSSILETSTKLNTQPTPTDDKSTFQTSGISTSQSTITEVSTLQPTTTEISSSQPTTEVSTSPSTITEISTSQPTTTEIPISQSTITEISTSQPTTTEILISQSTITEQSSTSEIPTSQPATTEFSTSGSTITENSTLQPTTTEISNSQSTSETSTTSEISIISQTTRTQMSSTHSTDHTIFKENKEGELTEPTIFEKTMEVTFSPSTVEVTTSSELNIFCPEPNGHFPHPADKHKFVACDSNTPYIFDCPSDLVYKHHIRRCDYE